MSTLTQKPSAQTETGLGIFDNDGLLNDIEVLRNSLWPVALSEFSNHPFTPKNFLGTLGKRSDSVVEEVRILAFSDLPEAEGRSLAIRAKARRDELVAEHIQAHGVPVREHAFETLDLFEELVVPKALATSSTAKLADPLIEGMQIRERFVAIATGDEVENGKPAPDLLKLAHQRAQESTGLFIPREKTLVLEDSNSGAEAGFAADMQVIIIEGVERVKKLVRDAALAVVSTHREAQERIREFFGNKFSG